MAEPLGGDELRRRLRGVRDAASLLTEFYTAVGQMIVRLEEPMRRGGWHRFHVRQGDPNVVFGGGDKASLAMPRAFLVQFPGVCWAQHGNVRTTDRLDDNPRTVLAHVFSFGDENYGAREPEAWLFVVARLRARGSQPQAVSVLSDLWNECLRAPADGGPPPGQWTLFNASTKAGDSATLHLSRVPLYLLESANDLEPKLVRPMLDRALTL